MGYVMVYSGRMSPQVRYIFIQYLTNEIKNMITTFRDRSLGKIQTH